MNNEETKKLCLELMSANSSEDVVEILKKNELWDNEKLWREYGDNPSAWAIVNNQGDELFALTEKITNSIDAVLMKECFLSGIKPQDASAPKSIYDAVHRFFENTSKYERNSKLSNFPTEETKGKHSFWEDKYSRSIDKNIALFFSGERNKNPNVGICDLGEGQTPEKFPSTILSLHMSNKEGISFTQGKWNQGGCGSIAHCEGSNGESLIFIITKRNPDILVKFPDLKTAKSDEWSFTILRREKTNLINGKSRLTYLAPIEAYSEDKKKLTFSFKSDTMPIFPKGESSSANAFKREVKYGTCVLHYDYKVRTKSFPTVAPGGINYLMQLQMPSLPLPFRLYDTRDSESQQREQSVQISGFSNYHDFSLSKLKTDRKDNLEEVNPSRGFITVKGFKIIFDIFCFKEGKGKLFLGNGNNPSNGIAWVVNGQTHAFQTNQTFDTEKLPFGEVKNDLFVVLDCSNISGSDREDVFKSDRSRVNEASDIVKEIRFRLVDELGKNESIFQIIDERITKKIKNIDISEKDLSDIQSLLDEEENLLKDFPEGQKIKKKIEVEKGSGDKILPLKEYPTFFEFKNLKGKKDQVLTISLEENKKLNLSMITDAKDNYFSRIAKKGYFDFFELLDGSRKKIKSFSGPNLKNGICTVSNIKTETNFVPGNLINLGIEVHDKKENKDGFKLNVNVIINPKQIKPKKPPIDPKPKPPHIPKNKFQGKTIIEELKQNPILAKPLTKDEWETFTKTSWHEEEVSHLYRRPISGKPGESVYELYYNRDNVHLINEINTNTTRKNPKEVMIKKYEMTLSILTMFTIMRYRKDRDDGFLKKIYSNETSDRIDLSETDSVDVTLRYYAIQMFKLYDFIFKKFGR